MFRNEPGYTLTEEFKLKRSEYTQGEKNPMFGKTGEKSPHYGKKRPDHSEKMTGANNPMFGRKHTEQLKKEHSLRMTGREPVNKNKSYEETYGKEKADQIKQRLRDANLGKSVQVVKVQCPYCDKIGSRPLMGRWHFDKCKFKK